MSLVLADSLTVNPPVAAPADVAVLGAARSGQAAAALLAGRGYRIYLSDRAQSEKLERECASLVGLGVTVELGRHDLERIRKSAFVVVSPGIDEKKGLLAEPDLRGIPLYSEIEVGFWFCPLPVVAITGTNGKSTTTALLGHILNAAGVPCRVAGNIGFAFCRAVRELSGEKLIVLEISSYQLHHILTFRPRIGLLLNLSPDHLDRYRSTEDYYAAKLRLFDNMQPEDTALLNADQPEITSRDRAAGKASRRWFGAEERQDSLAFIRGGNLCVRRKGRAVEAVMPLSEFPLPGRHNVENLLAAAAAAAALGLEPGDIAPGARSFNGLPHRLERVLETDGVTWINDSKATTVDSVLRALESLAGPLVLIMGGRHKGAPYSPLAGQVKAKVKRLILLGEAAELIEHDLGGLVPVTVTSSLEEASMAAWTFAGAGDTVLLSPGCSSFDMFIDFEERGDCFRETARRIAVDVS